MSNHTEIRESTPEDAALIEAIYPEAFPDEDLVPLVKDLLADASIAMSLVATIDSKIVGHAVFTHCGVSGTDMTAALLGPVAVAPDSQRGGVGSALIRDGLERMAERGVSVVLVLGDPAYYGRFGFQPRASIEAPYPLPAEWNDAWQSLELSGALAMTGKLNLPAPWRDPALWSP